jgi:hypothetical protein
LSKGFGADVEVFAWIADLQEAIGGVARLDFYQASQLLVASVVRDLNLK